MWKDRKTSGRMLKRYEWNRYPPIFSLGCGWSLNFEDGRDGCVLSVCRFTQNLSMFRRDINDSLKGPNMTAAIVGDMMTS